MAIWQVIESNNLVLGKRLDPEFYDPRYTSLINSLIKIKAQPLSHFSPIINRGKLPEYYNSPEVGVIKSAKVKNGFIEEIEEFVSYDFAENHPESCVSNLDILINSTGRGTLGRSSIFIKKEKKVIDGHITKVSKLKNISPYYVATFLLTSFGSTQLETMSRGSSGQIEIYPEDIENVLLPRLKPNLELKVSKLCEELYSELEKTKNFYLEINTELLKKMRWNDIKINHTLSYTSSIKDVILNSRFDADFFQPKFNNLKLHLQKVNSIRLGDFCEKVRRGASPIYLNQGKAVIVNSQNLSIKGTINVSSLDKTEIFLYENEVVDKIKLKKFDVLMYATGAYIGRTNCWLEEIDAIAGIDCLIIRPDEKICDPTYLSLFLNSNAGIMQADCYASGSAQRHLYPVDVENYQVFIPLDKYGKIDLLWQKQLAEKFIKASEAEKSAQKKLEEAKKIIEEELQKLIKDNNN